MRYAIARSAMVGVARLLAVQVAISYHLEREEGPLEIIGFEGPLFLRKML